ncbi:hypothetical protein [Dokdonella sp.]|uniref:hypothetical protein n=1 Tax=Dokdonella sp. TaxID=2291710 RepID=UPI001AFE6B54|nr:hypothetical protein [Dokdonella sp.]MBO9661575.1 hypothetical protein [Dokdonella sp.]
MPLSLTRHLVPLALALAGAPAFAGTCRVDGPYQPHVACAARAAAPLARGPLGAPPALPSFLMEMGRPGGGGSWFMRGWWSFDLADLYGTMVQTGAAVPVVDAWDLSADATTTWYVRAGADWGTQSPDGPTQSHGGLTADPIDPATTSLTDLAIDPRDGKGYVAAIRNDADANTAYSELYAFDTDAGALSLIGPMSADPAKVTALAMSCDGVLYGYDIVTDQLVRIDTATAAMTPVGGPSGQAAAINSLQSLAFDRRDGTLYGMLFLDNDTGDNVFGRFGADGAFTPIAPLQPPSAQPGIFRIKLPTTCAVATDTIFADGFDAATSP